MDNITITGVEEIQGRLSNLDKSMRRRMLRKISTQVIKKTKSRIDAQSDLSGSAWKKRSTRSNLHLKNKKMERGLRRLLALQFISDSKAVIGFKPGLVKYIAAIQQQGATLTRKKPSSNAKRNSPATITQARLMIQLGYKVGGKTPTLTWIKQNQTQGSAGIIIRQLQGRPAKSNWQVKIPARSFLGITAADRVEINQIITEEINRTLRNSNNGN